MSNGMISLKSIGSERGFKIETVTKDIDFTSSVEEDVTISIGKPIRDVIRGRLYVDEDPSAAFSAWATITFYNKSAMKGEDAFYRTSAKIVYTELEVATTGSDANITPDDYVDFNPNDLAKILDSLNDEYIRLMTIADTMIAEDNIGVHDIDDGLSRVIEFSNFMLFNLESGSDVYMRITFSSAQTVSLKLELELRD